MAKQFVRWFKELTIDDVSIVGGKNASLGEMYSSLTEKGVRIPNGFAITAPAYFYYLEKTGILNPIKELIAQINPESIKSVQDVSQKIRTIIKQTELPQEMQQEIIENYRELSKEYGKKNVDVAVRSSATAEDLPSASFAGQHESYLNIQGEENLIWAVRECISSLFLTRAIMYRVEKGFDHMKIGLSVAVQRMVRSDKAAAGIAFTLDTETGFKNVVVVNGVYGLGEMIVKGRITPDEFVIFKPTLKQGYPAIIKKTIGAKDRKYIYKNEKGVKETAVSSHDRQRFCITDEEAIIIARWASIIEEHYSEKNGYPTPQDVEWAKDGRSGDLFIVQSRPETVQAQKDINSYQEFALKNPGNPLVNGIAIGNKIGSGSVHIIENAAKLSEFRRGEVLVTKMTDPDWTSAMPLASAIITDEGGRTCHAAIISRELGIPCIVGTTNATKVLKNKKEVTVDCSSGLEGHVFAGKVDYDTKTYKLDELPKTNTKILVNIGAPDIAFQTSFLPQDGVGLAREEFIIAEKVKIHPLALYHFKELKDRRLKKKISKLTVEYKDKKEYFINELAEGIAQIAAAFYPKQVIVRFSDFKTNEYRNLLGGEVYEPADEQNPMIGYRGAARYVDKQFEPAFLMECAAIKRAKEVFGLTNIAVMVPFCRTIDEAKAVMTLIEKSTLLAGENKTKVYVMCEIPSNVILIDEFLDIFDGMSIGSNDLTQLTLGLDRDNGRLAKIGNENNQAVKDLFAKTIKVCKARNKYVGICGQGPSDYPELAQFLVEQGIESMSLNPDTVIKTRVIVAQKENELKNR